MKIYRNKDGIKTKPQTVNPTFMSSSSMVLGSISHLPVDIDI